MSTSHPATFADQIPIIRKMLALEARKGFQDTSVSGGFQRYFDGLECRLRNDSTSSPHLADIARLFEGYAALNETVRKQRVRDALSLLAGQQDTRPEPSARSSRQRGVARLTGAPQAAQRPRRRQPRVRIDSLDDPVTVLPRVGEGRARQLAALGAVTIRDLLYLLPRHHKDYSQVQTISSMLFHRECTVRGQVVSIDEHRTRKGRPVVNVEISDDTGRAKIIWFNPYISRQLTEGDEIAISGRVEQQRGMLCFHNPEWELLDAEMLHTGRLVPIYPLTRNLYQKQLRQITRHALDGALSLLQDPLSDEIRGRYELMRMRDAIANVHYPNSIDELQQARNRLAFDEFLVLQLGLVRRKVEWQSAKGHAYDTNVPALQRFIGTLPFEMTDAQQRSLTEILWDMSQPRPMSRLLQGDVGSGKTVVGASAALVATAAGHQAALLAPTEILAEQHFRNLSGLFDQMADSDRPRIALLTGKTPTGERADIEDGLLSGEIALLVGTHAILEEHVVFKHLGLAIIDEQHRFGVGQRAALREKGYNPDVLVMTATPIPRSLALVLHGDLDVSTIDELPPGRQPIITRRVDSSSRREVYEFVREQVADGHQAFIVYPLVEESEAIDARAATAEYERLARDVFPDLRLCLLHGRMKSRDKDKVMQAFRKRETDILVSTSVVEVGIDIPNATVMVIEGAERFGLSQLHQFRGRVGRGADHSYCILIADDTGGNSNTRLDAMVETQDGFRLSEIDLELRGPGEFFGKKQSGLPELKLASLGDLVTLNKARDEAHRILEQDSGLESAANAVIREQVERYWAGGAGDLS